MRHYRQVKCSSIKETQKTQREIKYVASRINNQERDFYDFGGQLREIELQFQELLQSTPSAKDITQWSKHMDQITLMVKPLDYAMTIEDMPLMTQTCRTIRFSIYEVRTILLNLKVLKAFAAAHYKGIKEFNN